MIRRRVIRVCRSILSHDTVGKHCVVGIRLGGGGVFRGIHYRNVKNGTTWGYYYVLFGALPQITTGHYLVDPTLFRQDSNQTQTLEAYTPDPLPKRHLDGAFHRDENIRSMLQDKPSKKSTGQDFKDLESFIDNYKPVVKKKLPRKVTSDSYNNPDTYSKNLNPFETDEEEEEDDLKGLNPFELDEDEDVKSLNPFDNCYSGDNETVNDPLCDKNPFDEEIMEEKCNDDVLVSSGTYEVGVGDNIKNNWSPDENDQERINSVKIVTPMEEMKQTSKDENTSLELESCSSQVSSVASSADRGGHKSISLESKRTHSTGSTSATKDVVDNAITKDTELIENSDHAKSDSCNEPSNAVQDLNHRSLERGKARTPPFENENTNQLICSVVKSNLTSNVVVNAPSSSKVGIVEDSLQKSSNQFDKNDTESVPKKQDTKASLPEESDNLRASETVKKLDTSSNSSSFLTPNTDDISDFHIDDDILTELEKTVRYDSSSSFPLGSVSISDGGSDNSRKQNDSTDGPSQNSKYERNSVYSDKLEVVKSDGCYTNREVVTSSSPTDVEAEVNGDIVLVTGGNGFLGQHIVKMLHLNTPHVKEIRILDKVPFVQKLDYEATKPVKVFTGDITHANFVKSSIKGVNSVLHIAGLVSFGTFPDIEGMKKVNVNGTLNVVNACLNEPSVSRLIYCSTVDVVVGHEPIQGGDEDNTSVPTDFLFPGYPETKYQGERLVLGASKSRCSRGQSPRLQTLALRANVMYGELDPYYVTSGLKMAKQRNGVLTQIGDGTAMFQQSYAGNTAWAFVCADRAMKDDPKLTSKYFYVPDSTPIQNSFNFMRPYLEARGFQLSENPISYNFVYGAISAAEKVAKLVSPLKRFNLPAQSCSIAYINMDLYFKGDKAKDELKYTPLFSPVEARLLSMKYYNKVEL